MELILLAAVAKVRRWSGGRYGLRQFAEADLVIFGKNGGKTEVTVPVEGVIDQLPLSEKYPRVRLRVIIEPMESHEEMRWEGGGQ